MTVVSGSAQSCQPMRAQQPNLGGGGHVERRGRRVARVLAAVAARRQLHEVIERHGVLVAAQSETT